MIAPVLLALALGAQPVRPAQFALLIGVNKPVDPELQPLRYADDDAARYQDLFRLLGARTLLLSRLDENTRRLEPQAAAEARDPVKSELESAATTLAAEVAQARARGVPTELYFIYAGHGNVRDGEGYITLEDARLTGRDLAKLIERIGADRAHVVVDACYSYFLAYSRGPGGTRQQVSGFSTVRELAADPKIGLLLSTSSARESHEWEGFQAGVFSHEVRSGLYGAADADGDGVVTYRELAAFIDRANAGIANEKFRPDVFARAPEGDDALLDLRPALSRRIEIDGAHAAHYLIEDGRGVRLADFHNAADATLHLLHPVGNGPYYLRRLDDEAEYRIAGSPDVLAVASLQPEAARTQPRGAADDTFSKLFALAFDEHAVQGWQPRPAEALDLSYPAPKPIWKRRQFWGYALVGAGALAGGLASAFAIDAHAQGSVPPAASQALADQHNQAIDRDDRTAMWLGIGAGAAVAGGLLLALWPEQDSAVAFGPDGSGVQIAGRF